MVGIKGTHGMEASRVEGIRIERKAARQRTRRGLGLMALMASVGLMVGLGAETSGAMDAPLMMLPGQVDVSARGDASYTIPIAVPPGTGGMVPSLALEYSSHGGNGIMGLGFSLTGIPAVGRCPRTVAQDGVRGSVNYTSSDRFCLEGQRLVATSGTYGANGTEYRTELEGFSKIISYGTAGTGPAWFKVWTKSGQIMEFGNTTNSRFLAQGKTTARSWGLNKVTDTVGNYLTVTYQNDTTNGQAYPTRIDYTGNAGASLTPYNSVRFVYNTNRPDKVPHYHAGSLEKTTVLLTNVQTYAGATRVSDYKITYGTSPTTDRSRVTQIELCDGGSPATCLPPTTFSWEPDGPVGTMAYQSVQQYTGYDFDQIKYTAVSGDFNGDGKADYLIFGKTWYWPFLSNGDGTFALPNTHTFPGLDFGFVEEAGYFPLTGDFNGDGRTDLVVYNSTHYWPFLTNADGTLAFQGTQSFGGLNFNNGNDNIVSGDFDGDGRAEFLFWGHTSYWPFLSDGDGTFTFQGTKSFGGPNFQQGPPNGFYSAPGDYNGDGSTDFFIHSATQYWMLLSDRDGTFTHIAAQSYPGLTFTAGLYSLIPGDFNGDGKSDVLRYRNSNYWVFLSDGDGALQFQSTKSFVGYNFQNGEASGFSSIVGDFNTDGKTDFILTKNNYYIPFLAEDGWDFDDKGVQYYPGLNFQSGPANGYIPISGDFTGDGKTEFLFHHRYRYYPFTANGPIGDLPAEITSGLGIKTEPSFKPITDSAVYTKDTDATYPTIDVIGPSYVVSRLDVDDGVIASPGTYSSEYRYAGLKADLEGRGFLGFRERVVEDLETGVVQTTTFRQDHPFIGLISEETKTHSTTTLNRTTNTFVAEDLGGGRYFVCLDETLEESTDLDGTTMLPVKTTYTYDGYGNALEVKVSTPDGASKVTTNVYANDTVNWILGRLTSASVTSTVTQPLPGGGTNSAPNAVDDTVSVDYETAKTVDPRTNDTDADGDTLTITDAVGGAKGTVAVLSNGTEVQYTPNVGESGADSFTYRIVDLRGGWDDATVNINIGTP